MRNRAENTNRGYAYSLGVWLNFLLTTDRNWWEATGDEVEAPYLPATRSRARRADGTG
jgi:hypothetical protein